MLFSSFVGSAANCGPLSDITLSGNLCSFHTLSLNNLANPFADVLSVVATKCAIFDNLSHTTRIASFPATSGSLTFGVSLTRTCVGVVSFMIFYFTVLYVFLMYYQSVSHIVGEISLYDSYFLLLVSSTTPSLFLIVYRYI